MTAAGRFRYKPGKDSGLGWLRIARLMSGSYAAYSRLPGSKSGSWRGFDSLPSCHRGQQPGQRDDHASSGIIDHAVACKQFAWLDARLFGVAGLPGVGCRVAVGPGTVPKERRKNPGLQTVAVRSRRIGYSI